MAPAAHTPGLFGASHWVLADRLAVDAVLEDGVQEAHDVAHALCGQALFEERSRERFDVPRLEVSCLAVSHPWRDVDALHVLAVGAVGLAHAAQLEALA